jgi:hypothetical protein
MSMSRKTRNTGENGADHVFSYLEPGSGREHEINSACSSNKRRKER